MIPCPACGRDINIVTVTHDVPYFGTVLLTSISCECGFKHADSIVTSIKEPVRFTIKINRNTLFTKVIRSTSGTIRILELGVDIEPGPASQAFVTNLEGVLARVEDIVRMARLWAESEEKVARCDEILKKIKNTVGGSDELTLILEDPFGNSLILSDKAVREKIASEEVASLKTGMTVMEISGKSGEELLNC